MSLAMDIALIDEELSDAHDTVQAAFARIALELGAELTFCFDNPTTIDTTGEEL